MKRKKLPRHAKRRIDNLLRAPSKALDTGNVPSIQDWVKWFGQFETTNLPGNMLPLKDHDNGYKQEADQELSIFTDVIASSGTGGTIDISGTLFQNDDTGTK